MNPVVAVLSADLHLSIRPPRVRNVDGVDWLEVQRGYLNQLDALCRQHNCPLVIAGDLCDRWNCPHEVVTMALRCLPDQTYGVCGNHDLPNHSTSLLSRSAFGVLIQAGKVKRLQWKMPTALTVNGTAIRLHGFSCGEPVQPLKTPHDLVVEVAVVHDYVWTKTTGYANAPQENRVGKVVKRLKGYDVAVFGDNHQAFEWKTIFNCGTLMRRKTDELHLKPSVGLLHPDGSVSRHFLDTSGDKFAEVADAKEAVGGIDLSKFVEELDGLTADPLDFRAAVSRALSDNNVGEGTKRAVLEAMET